MILFCDVEASGLDPDNDTLLEVACVVTEDDYTVRAEISTVVRYSQEQIEHVVRTCDLRVFEMHSKNELWLDLYAGYGTLLHDLDDLLVQFAENAHAHRAPVGGFSPQFDQRWLRRHAPRFLGRLSHRVHDVSTLRHVVRARYGAWGPPRTEVAHRALADCHEAIAYAKWFRRHCLIPYAPPGAPPGAT